MGLDHHLVETLRFLRRMHLSLKDLGDVRPHVCPPIVFTLRRIIRIIAGVSSLLFQEGNIEYAWLLGPLDQEGNFFSGEEVIVLYSVGTFLRPSYMICQNEIGVLFHPG